MGCPPEGHPEALQIQTILEEMPPGEEHWTRMLAAGLVTSMTGASGTVVVCLLAASLVMGTTVVGYPGGPRAAFAP